MKKNSKLVRWKHQEVLLIFCALSAGIERSTIFILFEVWIIVWIQGTFLEWGDFSVWGFIVSFLLCFCLLWCNSYISRVLCIQFWEGPFDMILFSIKYKFHKRQLLSRKLIWKGKGERAQMKLVWKFHSLLSGDVKSAALKDETTKYL